jgi:uncharacterized alpha-E superfamily protein
MCCASEPFAKVSHAASESERFVSFLLLDATFPRSIRFALREIDASLHRISGTSTGSFSNEAELMLGRLLGTLDFLQVGEVTAQGLGTFAQQIADSLAGLAAAIESVYFPRIPVA